MALRSLSPDFLRTILPSTENLSMTVENLELPDRPPLAWKRMGSFHVKLDGRITELANLSPSQRMGLFRRLLEEKIAEMEANHIAYLRGHLGGGEQLPDQLPTRLGGESSVNHEPKIPNEDEALGIPIPPVRPIPPTLDPLTAPIELVKKPGLSDRIRTIWMIVEAYVEEAVRAAEVLFGPQTGVEKKRWVTLEAMKFIKDLEGKLGLVPDWMEPVVMKSIEWGLNFMIDRLVVVLKDRKWAR